MVERAEEPRRHVAAAVYRESGLRGHAWGNLST
jgi:hypothetical protein